MSKLNIQLCPETGICSLIKEDGTKVDLMPNEVADLKEAGDAGAIKTAIGQVNTDFADALTDEEIAQMKKELG